MKWVFQKKSLITEPFKCLRLFIPPPGPYSMKQRQRMDEENRFWSSRGSVHCSGDSHFHYVIQNRNSVKKKTWINNRNTDSDSSLLGSHNVNWYTESDEERRASRFKHSEKSSLLGLTDAPQKCWQLSVNKALRIKMTWALTPLREPQNHLKYWPSSISCHFTQCNTQRCSLVAATPASYIGVHWFEFGSREPDIPKPFRVFFRTSRHYFLPLPTQFTTHNIYTIRWNIIYADETRRVMHSLHYTNGN